MPGQWRVSNRKGQRMRRDPEVGSLTGLPDFSWYKIPKRKIIYQITTNYTKCPYNITKDRKIDLCVHRIYQHLPLQDPPNFTQSWVFGLKQTIWQPCSLIVDRLRILSRSMNSEPTCSRVARFFLTHYTKMGENIPNYH
jgi:hypothetical protein